MTRGGAGRARAMVGATGAVLASLLLVGCTNIGFGDDEPDKPAATPANPPPPTLEPKWSIEGLNSNPEAVGAHHWMTYQAYTYGVGRNMSSSPGPTLLVDTRTGRTHSPEVEPERYPCLTPANLSDDGIVPVFWAASAADPGGSYRTETCGRLVVLDANSGKILWRDNSPDLSGLGVPLALGANERTVAVVDEKGRSRCYRARTGAPQPSDNASCVALTERLTHADLPELLDQDGNPAPLTSLVSEYQPTVVEIGRTDEVLLVRAKNPLPGGSPEQADRWMIRAHDLRTGETLWQDDDLAPDAHGGDSWSRDETYFVAPSGVARVSYEHPDDPEAASTTPMVVTAVDPRTGEDIKPVARIEGAWFNHQFDDVTVALTSQDRLLQSEISGFDLPTW